MTTKDIKHNTHIHVRLAGSADRAEVLELLRSHFYPEEPLTIGEMPMQQEAADEEFNLSLIDHGMSYVALDDTNRRIVGAILAGPKYPDEAEHMEQLANALGDTKYGRMLHFLAAMERGADAFRRYAVKHAIHVHAMMVHDSMRGCAITWRLMNELVAAAIQHQRHDVALITVDCTSEYSARFCARYGMECVHTMPYADYVDETGRAVYAPPAPHLAARTYAKLLPPNKTNI